MQATAQLAGPVGEITAVAALPARGSASGRSGVSSGISAAAPAKGGWPEFGNALDASLRAARATTAAMANGSSKATGTSAEADSEEIEANEPGAPSRPSLKKAEQFEAPATTPQAVVPSEGVLPGLVPVPAAAPANSLEAKSTEVRPIEAKFTEVKPLEVPPAALAGENAARREPSAATQAISDKVRHREEQGSQSQPDLSLELPVASVSGVTATPGGPTASARAAAEFIPGTSAEVTNKLSYARHSAAPIPAKTPGLAQITVAAPRNAGADTVSSGTVDSAVQLPVQFPVQLSEQPEQIPVTGLSAVSAASDVKAAIGPAAERESNGPVAAAAGSGTGDSAVATPIRPASASAASDPASPLPEAQARGNALLPDDLANAGAAKASVAARPGALSEAKATPGPAAERTAAVAGGNVPGAVHFSNNPNNPGDGIAKLTSGEGSSEMGGQPAAVLSRDPWAAMDHVAVTVRSLPGSSHAVEVGVDDPVHGWIEVRAQGVSGQVTAALTAGSPEAHAALHAALPGMAEFLAQREIGVRSLTVDGGGRGESAAHSGGDTGNFAGDSGGRGPNPNSGQDSPRSIAGEQTQRAIPENSWAMPASAGLFQDGGGQGIANGAPVAHRISVRV